MKESHTSLCVFTSVGMKATLANDVFISMMTQEMFYHYEEDSFNKDILKGEPYPIKN